MKTILVTGANGLVGTAIRAIANNYSQYNFKFVTRRDADLTVQKSVEELYGKFRPDYVIHTAAKVGGIYGNSSSHGEYFFNNTLINAYMLHYAMINGVEKMLAFSSVCVFPDGLELLREDLIDKGPVFDGNFAYGYAKRNVDVQIRAYQSQYGVKNWCSIIPGNIFGKADFYNLQHAHVIPALIHKLYLAKLHNVPLVVAGDGLSLREFIFADDLAKSLLEIIGLDKIPLRLIISGNQQYAIREIVNMLCEIADFDGEVKYDTACSNGQRSRRTDLTLLSKTIGLPQYTPMKDALRVSYEWFVKNYTVARK